MKRTKLYENNKLNPNHFLSRIILWYRKHFGESIFYSVELNKSYKFTSFFKKYWLLFVFLILPVFIAIIAYIVIKSNEDMKISESVSSFELISLLITYISSTLLGVVVYYHSWSQGKLEDKKNSGIYLRVETMDDPQNEHYLIFDEKKALNETGSVTRNLRGINTQECNFIKLRFNNLNHHSPIKINLKNAYYINDSKEVQEIKTSFITDLEKCNNMVNYNEPVLFFVGIDKKLFSVDAVQSKGCFRCLFLFEISNLDDKKVYCLYDLDIDSLCCLSDYATLLSARKFKELSDKYGVSFIKDVHLRRKYKKGIYSNISLYR